MIFLKPRTQSDKWSYEFMLITYSGLLKSYHISTTNEFEANYEFSFGTFYKNGINAVVYDEKHSLFYVAGNTISQKLMVINVLFYIFYIYQFGKYNNLNYIKHYSQQLQTVD